jgi:hypothetical protein
MRDEGLRLQLSRRKTSTESDLLVLCDRHNWLLCPLHALAALLAVSGAVNESLFPQIGKSAKGKRSPAAKHINALLAKVMSVFIQISR